jgi:teneurin
MKIRFSFISKNIDFIFTSFLSFFSSFRSSQGGCDCSANSTFNTPNNIASRLSSSTSAPIVLAAPMTGCICTPTKIGVEETISSTNIRFSAISALAVTQDNVLNVADQGSLQILALLHYLPSQDKNSEYQIPYPPTNEIYIFNRYGQHVATKDMSIGKTRYSFLYSKNTSFGKLSTVTDSTGNKIQFLRDYSNLVSSIENTQDHKLELKFSPNGFLTKIVEKGKSEIAFDYDENGLMLSRSGDGETFIHSFNDYGRIVSMILPTGETLKLSSKLNTEYGLQVDVQSTISSKFSTKSANVTSLKLNGGIKTFIMQRGNEATKAAINANNNTLSILHANKILVESAAITRHPTLDKSSLSVEAEMLPMWSHQTIQMGDTLLNSMYTTFSLVGGDPKNPRQTLSKEIWVNSTRSLGVRYEQLTNRETFYDKDKQDILSVTYNTNGLPTTFKPANGFPLNISYDRFSRVESWAWGPSELKYTYERHGLLSEVSSQQDGIVSYIYNDFNLLSAIGLASQRKFTMNYDSDGGLRSIQLPTGTKHVFDLQRSIGFVRFTYTPPGSAKPYLQHFSYSGQLLQTIYPGDGARIVYRYNPQGKLAEIVHGEGKSEFSYNKETGMPNTVAHTERELEYRWDFEYNGALLTEERIDFNAKTGLSNAKFTYEYDSNFRLISTQGRIGGQNLPGVTYSYSTKTGNLEQISQFKVSHPKPNTTNIYDGTATYTRTVDGRFLETEKTLYIHRNQAFKMEFSYDMHGRVIQVKTFTKTVGAPKPTITTKNFTWDCDGQLIGVDAQEPWNFRYDDNGNMLALSYRGSNIPMEYNQMDRITKFAENFYKYDERGHIVQNAREEKFHYNTQGLLVRAVKKSRFDVRYFYDHLNRLAVRKDNQNNVTQFFYNNQERPFEVSQIYSPRDNKLTSLTYDDRGHVIFVQSGRNKFYVATDQTGTPVIIFNQYGEGIREMMRSPFGHIVYDSNPYLYLPIDFNGGILDPVTSLVHMANGKVYDSLVGLFMTPNWENTIDRIEMPTKLHQYRFNGNDPVNSGLQNTPLEAREDWLEKLGYKINSLAPQYNEELKKIPSPWGEPTSASSMKEFFSSHSFTVESGFLAHLKERRLSNSDSLKNFKVSELRSNSSPFANLRLGSSSDPPFGKGIVVTRTLEGRAIVSSVPAANPIYRDVYTSIFNRTIVMPFTFVIHNSQHDVFHFIKEETWRSSEDRQQLKRLQGQVNTTYHRDGTNKESEKNPNDVKIHGTHAIINLRYGTTFDKEKQRLMHHAKLQAVRKAWAKEKELLADGLITSTEWNQAEVDEILKLGYSNYYDCQYIHDVNIYPELSEDPYNVKFVKKKNQSKRKRRDLNEIENEFES